MKLIRSGLAMLLFVIVSCNSQPRKQGENYLNPATYLRNELALLDSGNYSFTRELLHDSIPADTLAMDTAAISAEIRQFLIKELEPGNFERYFQETSFADATTNRITFSYATVSEDCPVTQVDMYVNPQSELIDQVYLSMSRKSGDTLVQQKLLWKHGSHYMLYSTHSVNNTGTNRVERISWHQP